MSRSTWSGRLLRRLPLVGDTGSLPLAALLAIVGVGLSTLLLPVTVAQIASTRTQVERVRALHAAQAGLDVALGRIRAAQSAGAGRLDLLPCLPLSGSMQAGGGPRFDVEIFYLNVDPRGRGDDDAWLRANKQTCRAAVTTYALLRSRGRDGAASRRLWGTYVFRTTDEPILQGQILSHPSATGERLCLDAGSPTPGAGTQVRMQEEPCNSDTGQPMWAYRKNLYIELVGSRTPENPTGLCLDAGWPHATENVVRLQPCAKPDAARQRWSFNSRANFEGTSDGKTLNGFCFNVQRPEDPGSPLVLGDDDDLNCNSKGVFNTRVTFAPDSAVGAGAAGPDTGQLVNRGQFGRCVDLPQKTNPAWVSVFPCNQAPDSADVALNQKWTLPGTPGGRIVTVPINRNLYPANTYCLSSPGAPDQYVDAIACPSGWTTRDLKWTVRGYTGTYATSYRIEDDYGYCLAAKDRKLGDFHSDELGASKLIVTRCSADELQKWNAPASLAVPRFTDIGEK